MQPEFRQRLVMRCSICDFAEIRTDEVVDHGPVLLAECPRCDHRWTQALPTLPQARVRSVRHPTFREVVHAA
jgi:hypothetical protein